MEPTARTTGQLTNVAIAVVYVTTALVMLAKYQNDLAAMFARWRSWYAVEEWPNSTLFDDVKRGLRRAD